MGLGFMVWDSGFGVYWKGVRAQGFGGLVLTFRATGIGPQLAVEGLGFRATWIGLQGEFRV